MNEKLDTEELLIDASDHDSLQSRWPAHISSDSVALRDRGTSNSKPARIAFSAVSAFVGLITPLSLLAVSTMALYIFTDHDLIDERISSRIGNWPYSVLVYVGENVLVSALGCFEPENAALFRGVLHRACRYVVDYSFLAANEY